MASPFGTTAPTGSISLFGSPFGAAPAAAAPSPFGTPAAATSRFGMPAAVAPFPFGAPAAAVPSPFGAPAAASTPGFSFGQAQAPTATAGGLFGSTSTPGVSPFGATSSPSLFGANSSPSLFGTSTAGAAGGAMGSLFAGTAPAFGASPFGAQQTAPSLFGASAPATAAGGAFSFFGTSAPATTSTAMFGTSTGGSLFSSFALPSSQQQQQLQQQQLAAAAAVAQQDGAVREIQEIKAAYTPSHPSYKFQYLLFNVVDNPAARVKPPHIDETRWRQALAAAGGPSNDGRLWPVPACGFKDLLTRAAAQQVAINENGARLKQLQDLAFQLAKRQGAELKQRAAEIQRRHQELASRLLHTWRLLDGLESRLANTIGYRADVAHAKEEQLSTQLGTVEGELAPGSVTGLTRRLDAVAGVAQLRAANPAIGSGASMGKLDEHSSSQLISVLRDHAEGVAKLQALLASDLQDVAIMRHELAAANGTGLPRGVSGGGGAVVGVAR